MWRMWSGSCKCSMLSFYSSYLWLWNFNSVCYLRLFGVSNFNSFCLPYYQFRQAIAQSTSKRCSFKKQEAQVHSNPSCRKAQFYSETFSNGSISQGQKQSMAGEEQRKEDSDVKYGNAWWSCIVQPICSPWFTRGCRMMPHGHVRVKFIRKYIFIFFFFFIFRASTFIYHLLYLSLPPQNLIIVWLDCTWTN